MRQKTLINVKNQIPRFNHPDIKNIKSDIKTLSEEHGVLLKRFNDHYDDFYISEPIEQKNTTKTELYNSIQEFNNRVKAYRDKYKLDAFFLNEFVLLQLKAGMLLSRVMELIMNVSDYEKILQFYITVKELLGRYIEFIEFREDRIFQDEMYFCNYKIALIVEHLGTEFKKFIEENEVFYKFSLKCSDEYMKLNLQLPVVTGVLLCKSIQQIEKTKLSRAFVGYFESVKAAYAKLEAKNDVNFEARLKYINANYIIFKFFEETHPTLVGFNYERDFKPTNKENLKKIYKVHDHLKHTYIGEIVECILKIDLALISNRLAEISEFRMLLNRTFIVLKNDIDARFKWIKMLNCIDDKVELEACRDTIVAHYKYVESLYVIGSKFLETYQKICLILSPRYNFQGFMQNLDEINAVITTFKDQEIIRDAACQSEKEQKLQVVAEFAKYLVAYENRQKAFALEKRQKRQARQVSKTQTTVQAESTEIRTKKHSKKSHDTDRVESVPEKTSVYLEHAWTKISKSKYEEAVSSYQLAHADGIRIEDMDIQLMALDGLSTSYANLLLKDLNALSTIFKNRGDNSPPLTRTLRINLEVAMTSIIYKLDEVASLYCQLIPLSQSNENIDTDYIQFIQNQLDDLLNYVEQKIKNIQQKYSDILKKSETDRKTFIQKLGKTEAEKLHMNLGYSELMDLGNSKFISIGNNKMEMGHRYSDHTNERLLMSELDPWFKYLSSKKLSLLPTELRKIGTHTTYKPVCTAKSKMVMGSVKLVLPQTIQEMFQKLDTLDGIHCLRGSAVIDLILKKYNLPMVGHEDMDFLTTSKDQQALLEAGFNKCIHNDDLFYSSTSEGRIDLLTIQDDPVQFMLQGIFTISTLYCTWKGGDEAICHDLTGKGLRDLEQMRLVMTTDPDTVFAKDPVSILLVQKYCLKGFHPDLALMNALRNVKISEHFDQEHFNDVVTKKLATPEYAVRKKYVQWFIQYGLLGKLFDIDECRLSQAVEKMERKFGLSQLSTAGNQYSLYAGKDETNRLAAAVHHNGPVI